MTNSDIAANFDALARLLELYNEDSFKIRAYQNAARTIKNYPAFFSEMSLAEISAVPGIGKATANKISELLQTSSMQLLEDLIATTPAGVIDMMNIKGIGVKKLQTIWKELNIDNPEDLLKACKDNRLSTVKGFGEKTQKKIEEAIEFHIKNQSKSLLATVLNFASQMDSALKISFPENKFLLTGDVYMHNNIVDKIQWVTDADDELLKKIKSLYGLKDAANSSADNCYMHESGIEIRFVQEAPEMLVSKQFELSCAEAFYEKFSSLYDTAKQTEEDIFKAADLQFIHACLRNNVKWIEYAKKDAIPPLIKTDSIKGIIHCHSSWSDGGNTIEEIVNELRQNGFEYLVISDHSKSAFYAEGLKEDRVMAQHKEIDELNDRFTDFTVFKSIESDILNNGSLDYEDNVLSMFDLVIASVHTNLGMNEENAVKRIITAVENPYTSILGHMTGRLLLMRKGYPVNHKKIIDACAANDVVIELNANPRRLDMDWRYIDYALDKGVLISINPDAHNLRGLYDIHYGVLSAQKAGLTKENNLSSYNLTEIKTFIARQKQKRPFT